MTGKLSGIEGVLGDLVSAPPAPPAPPKPALPEPPPPAPATVIPPKPKPPKSAPVLDKKPAPAAQQQPARVKARMGRPLGRKSGERERKEKATLWVTASLIADYRNWSWEARCNVSELIDRALLEYQQRHRRQPKGE